jgi:hypothetical protein
MPAFLRRLIVAKIHQSIKKMVVFRLFGTMASLCLPGREIVYRSDSKLYLVLTNVILTSWLLIEEHLDKGRCVCAGANGRSVIAYPDYEDSGRGTDSDKSVLAEPRSEVMVGVRSDGIDEAEAEPAGLS